MFLHEYKVASAKSPSNWTPHIWLQVVKKTQILGRDVIISKECS